MRAGPFPGRTENANGVSQAEFVERTSINKEIVNKHFYLFSTCVLETAKLPESGMALAE